MAAIQVHTIKTTILEYFWMVNDMDNESEEYNKITLREFEDKLTESLSTYHRTSVVKWEVEEDANHLIKFFALRRNIENKLA